MSKKMSAKEYLQQSFEIPDKIRDKKRKRRDLFELAVGGSYDTTGTGGRSNAISDKVGKTAGRIADLDSEIERLFDLQNEIEEMINKVKCEKSRKLLYKRYVLLLSWEHVAVEIGYTYRHTLSLHGDALIEFNKNFHPDFI